MIKRIKKCSKCGAEHRSDNCPDCGKINVPWEITTQLRKYIPTITNEWTVKYKKNVVVYPFCNIWGKAKIGANVQIGSFTEIGDDVLIGDNVKIGAHCFIPPGVVICNNAWIGPRTTFTNDMYPPSPDKKYWQGTLVESFAAIGAGVTVRPGIIIGKGALVGAGSTVTRNIPPFEVWAGNPCKFINYKVECHDIQ